MNGFFSDPKSPFWTLWTGGLDWLKSHDSYSFFPDKVFEGFLLLPQCGEIPLLLCRPRVHDEVNPQRLAGMRRFEHLQRHGSSLVTMSRWKMIHSHLPPKSSFFFSFKIWLNAVLQYYLHITLKILKVSLTQMGTTTVRVSWVRMRGQKHFRQKWARNTFWWRRAHKKLPSTSCHSL